MSRPLRLRSRVPAFTVAVALVAPLVAASHHHEVDHDGATHHIEAAHGAHAPALAEADDRLTSGAPKVPLAPVATHLPALWSETPTAVAEVAGERCTPSSRAPPRSTRSRAPPCA